MQENENFQAVLLMFEHGYGSCFDINNLFIYLMLPFMNKISNQDFHYFRKEKMPFSLLKTG